MAKENDIQTPASETVDPAPSGSVACTCWSDRDKKLRDGYGLKISDTCEMLTIGIHNINHSHCLPLQRVDGKKLGRSDPKVITISHCPFCGSKL